VIPQLIEIKDGLLADADNVIMKAREPELFPCGVFGYFHDKTKVRCEGNERSQRYGIREKIKSLFFEVPRGEIYHGVTTVTVRVDERRAVFDAELFDYADKLGIVDCYLSNVALPGEEHEYYPLFIKYTNGWICMSPMEA